MRLRTLGAVCASCAAAVPISVAAAADPPAPAPNDGNTPPPPADLVAGTPIADAGAAQKKPLIERQIRLQRVHHRLHGERFTAAERSAARVALATLTPEALRTRTRGLRGHVRELRQNADRKRYGGAPDIPIPAALESIAMCESHGNPRAVSASGTYRGKYQFDYGTWASVGGDGDPAGASETEQDRRAAMLYKRSGATPWPVCGR